MAVFVIIINYFFIYPYCRGSSSSQSGSVRSPSSISLNTLAPKKPQLLFHKTLADIKHEEHEKHESGLKLLNDEDIPFLLVDCDAFMREKDNVKFDGILRSSGIVTNTRNLRDAYEKGDRLIATEWTEVSIEAVASLFKSYLRELPESLLPVKVHTDVFDVTNNNLFIDKMAQHLVDMSYWYRQLLEFVMSLFKFIAENQEFNRMTPLAIAAAVRPSILHIDHMYFQSGVATDGKTIAADTQHAIDVIAKMIEDFGAIKEKEEEIKEVNREKEKEREIEREQEKEIERKFDGESFVLVHANHAGINET